MFTVQEMEWTRTSRTVIQETKTMNTNTKLYGKDLSIYDEMDIDDLLSRLTSEELEQLSKEVDPDDSLLPPSQRCRDQTKKLPTGPLNRRQLLQYIETKSREEEDWPDVKPFVPGLVRGKVWQPKDIPKQQDEEGIALDIGDEFETALSGAPENDLVDLAAILGLHSMMNQDQFHASIGNRGQKFGSRFESIVKATQPKVLPMEPPNPTEVDKSVQQVESNDPKLQTLNLNNIKNISQEKFARLFEGLKKNSNLETLCLANTRLTDAAAKLLCDALTENRSLKVVNVESNFITPSVIRDLVSSLLATQNVIEFRATNQKPEILGVKTEMEIAKLVEDNRSLMRLGISFDVPDARIRVQHHLQRNNDNVRVRRMGGDS